MNERKAFQNGITLIALVISIIVMLILAGVSLNATIGDNGIITQAQNAKYTQGIATLEEYLQEKYVENYDSVSEYNSKLDGMINTNGTKNLFQKSSSNNYYFLSPNTYKEYYFIEKSELPEDIQKAIIGGDNSLTGKTIYAEFDDIYGINSDLEVFYCSNGYDSWIGGTDTADVTDMTKPVFPANDKWAEVLGIEGDVTLSDIRSVQDLTLSNNSVDISELGNFASLKTISINTNFENLNGIEEAPNLTTVYIKSSANIQDYSAIGKIKNLTNLYFIYSNDNELKKFCSSCKDYDMTKLKTLCISSEDSRYYFETLNESIGDGSITTIEPLSELSNATKASIQYLCISGNKINSLTPLRGFTSLYFLNARKNNITSFDGLQDSKNLTYLCMNQNQLGKDLDKNDEININTDGLSVLANVTGNSYSDYSYTPVFPNLNYLNIYGNSDVVWIDYVKSYSNLKYFYLIGCGKLNTDSLTNMKSKLKSITGYSLDNKYSLIMMDENSTLLNLSSQKIEKSVFLGLKNYSKVVELNLTGASIYEGERKITGEELNNTINTLLKNMPRLKYLSLNGFTDLSDFSFLKNLKELIVLDIRSTNASTLNSQTGLELLNDISTMRQLAVSGANIDLTKLQKTINRLGAGYSTTFTNGQPAALLCTSWTSLSTLANCTELTKIDLRVRGFGTASYGNNILDLSKLTLATTYYDMYVYNLTVILPSSITRIDTGVDGSVYLDARNCENINSIYTHSSVNALGILETAKSFSSIKTLYIKGWNDTQWAIANMDKIAKCTNLKYLRLGNVDWDYIDNRTQVASLTNLEKLANLEYLTVLELYKMKVNDNDYSAIGKIKSLTNLSINLCNISDVSWIGSLENLTNLTIINSQLNKGIKALSNLSKLKYLNLQNNTLYDMSLYENQVYNTCEVLASMNKYKGGALENLFLAGNPNITDFSFVKECKWTSKSGF